MLNKQLSININIKRNDSFLVPENSTDTTSIVVNISDQVSSIFNAIGSKNRQAKIVFNGQILCPALSFSFYNIHDNDSISIVSPITPVSFSFDDLSSNDNNNYRPYLVVTPHPIQISRKRFLLHSNSSNYFKSKIFPNKIECSNFQVSN